MSCPAHIPAGVEHSGISTVQYVAFHAQGPARGGDVRYIMSQESMDVGGLLESPASGDAWADCVVGRLVSVVARTATAHCEMGVPAGAAFFECHVELVV